jgi:NAD(P)H-hydrate epimerase
MMGAAVLASKAALKTGCGLITTHAPKKGYEIMQLSIPEAIVSIDENDECFSKLPDISKFNAVGIGPGLGTDSKSESALHSLLLQIASPLVIDADAINILAKNKDWLSLLPKKTILTPHLNEFERLFGMCNSQYERWLTQLKFSTEYNIIILLKGAYSSISLPDGTLHINSTGNPGMATAGCGDVLTGMIISLLAQGYTPEESTLLGTWLHGKAADIYVCDDAMESLIASSIIQNIGKAFLSLEQTT